MTENTDLQGHDDRAGAQNYAPSDAPTPVTGTDGETSHGDDDGNRGPEGHDSNEDTFPRDYVEKLRDENARYRQRAGKADDLARRVHRLQVEATGLLADPDDLEFNEDHLDDEEALTAAIDDLLARKPHLAARRPRGDVGQGITDAGTTDLASILRRAAN